MRMKNLLSVYFSFASALCAIFGSPCISAAETVTYYYTNELGTVLAATDATGNVVVEADYRPYGGQALGAPTDGPGYTGHVNDAGVGLVYMQARYYDPSSGRFLSTDAYRPDVADVFNFNRYEYAHASPFRFYDPDGKQMTLAAAEKEAKKMNDSSGKSDYVVVPVEGGYSYMLQQPAALQLAIGTDRAAVEYSAKTPAQCAATCTAASLAIAAIAGDQSKQPGSDTLNSTIEYAEKAEKVAKIGENSTNQAVREFTKGAGALFSSSKLVPVPAVRAALLVPATVNNFNACMKKCTSDEAARVRDDADK
ncbi:RHS repeat domain-containing protein [Pinirhizobacter soli]|uniref:RHS repeat domain-containing protein n=1 Tax=Pinirhizobacter soli TaxID=2786953 RepID=UPI00202AA5E7|nr:RHS repeat-associated core domain-containing protein [Pinirhizobacter soli]